MTIPGTTEAAASAAVTTAKIVVVLDHLKNNRIGVSHIGCDRTPCRSHSVPH